MAKKGNLSEKARKAGLDPSVVYQRVNNLGWDVERALSTPVRKVARNKPATVAVTPPDLTATTTKPSPMIPDARKRVEELEAELLKAKRNCKLAQIAALCVIVAVVMWAVNP
jgi:hypothetical protein